MSAASQNQSHRVLILEDDRDSRMLLEMIVAQALPGSKVSVIASVAESKKLADAPPESPFNVALLDVMLLDGTVVEAWPYLKPLCQGAVVLLSALAEQEVQEIAGTLNAHATVQKPYSPVAVSEAIKQHLEGAP